MVHAAGETVDSSAGKSLQAAFDQLVKKKSALSATTIETDQKYLSQKYNLTLTPSRADIVADFYTKNTMDVANAFKKVKLYSDEIKNAELSFYKQHDINIVMEEDAIDHLLEKLINGEVQLNAPEQSGSTRISNWG